MNIPLNIDWQQILLHLLNLLVLLLGLYLLLYKPVRDFMEKRTDYYRRLQDQTREKLNRAEELEESCQRRLLNIEDELGEKKKAAVLEAEREADLLLKNAKEQASAMLSEAQSMAQQERTKILDDAQQEITALAIAATEKLLSQKTAGALDQFLGAVKKG